jgi:hypothetical protein
MPVKEVKEIMAKMISRSRNDYSEKFKVDFYDCPLISIISRVTRYFLSRSFMRLVFLIFMELYEFCDFRMDFCRLKSGFPPYKNPSRIRFDFGVKLRSQKKNRKDKSEQMQRLPTITSY